MTLTGPRAALLRPDGLMILNLSVLDPALLLNANQRPHWTEARRLARYWRLLSATETRSAINRRTWAPLAAADITCTVTFPPDRRRRDPANWAPTAKALIDGLVDAGLLPDDDHTHVTGPDMRLDQGEPAIRLEITARQVTP